MFAWLTDESFSPSIDNVKVHTAVSCVAYCGFSVQATCFHCWLYFVVYLHLYRCNRFVVAALNSWQSASECVRYLNILLILWWLAEVAASNSWMAVSKCVRYLNILVILWWLAEDACHARRIPGSPIGNKQIGTNDEWGGNEIAQGDQTHSRLKLKLKISNLIKFKYLGPIVNSNNNCVTEEVRERISAGGRCRFAFKKLLTIVVIVSTGILR